MSNRCRCFFFHRLFASIVQSIFDVYFSNILVYLLRVRSHISEICISILRLPSGVILCARQRSCFDYLVPGHLTVYLRALLPASSTYPSCLRPLWAQDCGRQRLDELKLHCKLRNRQWWLCLVGPRQSCTDVLSVAEFYCSEMSPCYL